MTFEDGIHVPSGSTLNIFGGEVTATGGSNAAGIGSGSYGSCGDIYIANGAEVTAKKGDYAPNSIGACYEGTCGTITVEDGANVIYE